MHVYANTFIVEIRIDKEVAKKGVNEDDLDLL